MHTARDEGINAFQCTIPHDDLRNDGDLSKHEVSFRQSASNMTFSFLEPLQVQPAMGKWMVPSSACSRSFRNTEDTRGWRIHHAAAFVLLLMATDTGEYPKSEQVHLSINLAHLTNSSFCGAKKRISCRSQDFRSMLIQVSLLYHLRCGHIEILLHSLPPTTSSKSLCAASPAQTIVSCKVSTDGSPHSHLV